MDATKGAWPHDLFLVGLRLGASTQSVPAFNFDKTLARAGDASWWLVFTFQFASNMADQVVTPTVGVGGGYGTPWDNRPVKVKNVLLQVCGFILVMELAERLSYYGINQGLKNFMGKKLGWSSVSSNSIKSTWTSVAYMTPLLGAYIADERWGRYKTIVVFGTWYMLGDVMLAIAAHPSVLASASVAQGLFITGLFVFIGVGTGAIKSNVITLGADQFNPQDDKETTQKMAYFSYFYWCINAGAAFSYGYLATLSVKGSGIIPKEYGYFGTFTICAGVFIVALIVFLLGTSRYIRLPPNSDAMSKLVKVLIASSSKSSSARFSVFGFVTFMLSFIVNLIAVFLKDGSTERLTLSYIAGGFAVFGVVFWVYFGRFYNDMDAAKTSNGGTIHDSSIDDIKQIVRVLPFAAFMVTWHCVYDQIDANFQSIAQQTDLRFGNDRDSTQLPGAVLGVFDPISIVILIPVLENVVYPMYTKWTGKAPSPFGKTTTGLIIAAFTMFYTGGFETIRRNSEPLLLVNSTGQLDYVLDESSELPMNAIAWGWNIPHYVLVGLCECLINVTAYDVFYSEVPPYLKSTSQAINLFMTSMGSNVTSIFTLLFQKYIPNDLNDGHLEYMFFGVGAIAVINVLVFLWAMKDMQFGMSSTPRGGDAADNEFGLSKKESHLVDAEKARLSYA
ncbi:hypothetical protein Ae201684P_016541 [Aphanomyces euteiches]|uniref:Major facilitator superfamily (MFS) profile domain-containing protein n=1 Tax=Aphanomyces euteiches TaxID=100861 RepID=A0A6G0WMC7_9STRA|nr:hypothetical protein Ae201684_013683 [Aphanomyces euteiches]KAH9093921.1 hypothetical protein Ae201684P_016541 [Aphanomyces euteiches]KAH9156144.1 hypothetical protein AeRB84_001930 [Aphanomyces euteiches]